MIALPRPQEIPLIHSFFEPITGTYFNILYAALLTLIALVIYISRKKVVLTFDGNNDAWSQVFMAINTLEYKTLSPIFKNFDGQKGYFHYPLGFFWLTGILTRQLADKKVARITQPNDSIRCLFPNMDAEESSLIDTYIENLHKLSGVYFPTAIVSFIALSFYIVLPHTLITAFSIICAIILIDAMMSRNYSISTRNVGLMGFGVCITGLLTYLILPEYLDFTGEYWFFGYIYEWLIPIIWALSLGVVIQTSQRGSQLFVSLSLATCLIYEDIAHKVLVGALIGIVTLIQIPVLNTLEHLKTHLLNRIHESQWIVRSYGFFRYSLFAGFNSAMTLQFVKDVFYFDFMKIGLEASYFKKNFLSLFLIYRVYLYLLILIISCPSLMNASSLVIGKIVFCAAVIPAILVFWRPLQGYGDGSLYFQGIYPYAFITSGYMLYNCIQSMESTANNISTSLFIVYVVLILYLYDGVCIFFNFQSIRNLGPQKNLVTPARFNFSNSKILNTVKFLDNISSIKTKEGEAPIRIMSHEVHSIAFIDTIVGYINKQPKDIKFKSFKLIDNVSGGYYDYWNGWSFDDHILINSVKPDLLLLDVEKPKAKYLLKALLRSDGYRNSLIFWDTNLAFVSLSGRFRGKEQNVDRLFVS